MTMKSAPYDVVKDFAPVALVAKAPLSVAIDKNLPVTDIKSLHRVCEGQSGQDDLRRRLDRVGRPPVHRAAQARGRHRLPGRAVQGHGARVPGPGRRPIDGFIDPILGSLQYHKAGMLRVVAVTSQTRAPNLPDVPTVGETIPGYEFYSWYGLWGPAKLPADITQRLNAEVNKALAGDMKDKLAQQGLLLTPGSVDDFVKFQRDDMARAQKIITEGNIRVE